MADVLDREQISARTAPAPMWRNRWLVLIPADECSYQAGEEYWDGFAWPTKEVAEQKACDDLAWDLAEYGLFVEAWVGAFPDCTSQGETSDAG